MKNKEIISDIDFFRLRLQEIDDAFVEIEYELKEGYLCEKTLGNLNFAICMLYEKGIPFVKKLCEIHSIKLKKH